MAEASGRIKTIKSDEDFEKELRKAGDRLVIVDFFSDEYVLQCSSICLLIYAISKCVLWYTL